jgi:hypothetical protein
VGERLISSNWAGQRGGIRLLDLKGVIEVIRSSRNLPLSLRFGGFDVARESSFSSRGLHPGIRSFSIQARIAVAMGWPVVGDAFPPAIDLLRRELAPVGALHKYHVSEGEIDNDFFFVLGQVERRGLEKTVVAEVQQRIRHFLSSREVDIHLRRDDLSLVAYEETTLALTRTRQFSLDDIAADPMLMINLYDAAV